MGIVPKVGAGKSAVEREAPVFQQVWEWWFLTFDLLLLHYNTPHCGNQPNVLTLPWVPGALNIGYSADAPLFSSCEVTYITLRWAFRRLLRHCIRNKGAAGACQHTSGAWAWKPLPGKPLSPIPEPIGAGDLTQAKNFTGPRGALMRGSHWELCFLHCEERGWVKLQRSGRKLECIPQ